MKAEDIENYLSQLGQELLKRGIQQPIHYDLVIVPDGKLWKAFGPFHIYAPPQEYILALKIFAGREKDIEDCKILLQQGTITTQQQAQMVLDRYILPDAQQNNTETIESSLNTLFGKQRQPPTKNDGVEQ